MPELTLTEYDALKADIARRGVVVPVVEDQHGNLLDGHHRRRAAAELGIDCPVEIRTVADDADAREVALILNVLRRQMGPLAWAESFRKLAAARGVELGRSGRQKAKTDTMAALAAEVGVAPRTARRRLGESDKVRGYPDLVAAVESGGMDLGRAARVARERVSKQRRDEKAAEFAERARQLQRDGVVEAEQVFDHWMSPRQWLLRRAETLDHRNTPDRVRGERYPHRLSLPPASGYLDARDIPGELADDPSVMAAMDKTKAAVDDIRREAIERLEALYQWAAEQRASVAEDLRSAVKEVSDEPTILVGRSWVRPNGGIANRGSLAIPQVKTPHAPDDCACGDAAPLGCAS
jgi:ParB-like chromosome segregation protein Spo0J/plasmid stabilization system protein ParE